MREHRLAPDISIHAPRTGSDQHAGGRRAVGEISIHAPRTGSDTARGWAGCAVRHFNPRSPHGERPPRPGAAAPADGISIHAPRTGSDPCPPSGLPAPSISIHAPRTGSDDEVMDLFYALRAHFNPRSPHGERRKGRKRPQKKEEISIHAPRTGSDITRLTMTFWQRSFQSTLPARGATVRENSRARPGENFNPRSPHGERPGRCIRRRST